MVAKSLSSSRGDQNPKSIRITLKPQLYKMLTLLKKNKSQSFSKIAEDLMEESLERQEDIILSQIAEERDQPSLKRISHKDAWK